MTVTVSRTSSEIIDQAVNESNHGKRKQWF